MQTIRNIFAGASMLIILSISSCKVTQVQPVAVTGLNKLRVTGVSLHGLKEKVSVVINNPNPFAVTLYRSDLEIKINDIHIGRAAIRKKIVLPANSQTEQVLYAKSDFLKLELGDIPKAIDLLGSKSSDLNLSMKGNLSYGKGHNKNVAYVAVSKKVNIDEKINAVTGLFTKHRK